MTSRKLSIGIGAQSKQHKKYLGDANDPHFVPKSPLIERQRFSEKEEAELKHLCTLALADVPHSDNDQDDPYRYLRNHITKGSKPAVQAQNANQQPPQVSRKAVAAPTELGPEPETLHLSTGPGVASNDSATPSDTSKRETIQTNETTPMTTPALTPSETNKRLSDALKRPSTAAPSQLRTEFKSSKGGPVYSFLKESTPKARPQTSSATKSLTHLPSISSLHRGKSKQNTPNLPGAKKSSKATIGGQPNFNKSLPSLPQCTTNEDVPPEPVPELPAKEKTRAITRMLKTVRLQRTQPAPVVEVRSTSTDAPRYLAQLDEIHDANNPRKQRRFNITHLFHKRANGGPMRATVG